MKLPKIGFGTWEITGQECVDAVTEALKTGYLLVDTAKIYGNESEVGKALRQSTVPREDILVTTKLWPSDFGYDNTLQAFDDSLGRLGLDYIDLYLIHWPREDKKARHESWRAMEELKKQKLAKNIGVSNFQVSHLKDLLAASDTLPAVNQIEFHPYIYHEQKSILDFCRRHKIAVEAYSPLSRGHGMDSITAMDIAERSGRTPAQILLRWAVQHGTVPIPKSAHAERIRENFNIFDFELSEEDVELLNSLSN
jgi:diketogulonate reductase-like aldo/keto reductase